MHKNEGMGAVSFGGVREWMPRWNVLRDITNYKEKRILELGCNSGLLSTYLSLYEHPHFVLGVDGCEDIIKSAHLVALALNASSHFDTVRISKDMRNMHKESWQDKLGYNFDIVFCLSLYRWVSDQPGLLKYLLNFNEVIFENHDNRNSLAAIVKSFEAAGYEYKVIRSSAHKDYYGRSLVHFYKI